MRLLKRTWADISLDNLVYNYTFLRSKVPGNCKFLGVVKADGYGHGAVAISRRLKELGAEYLAVSNFEEALQIRRADIRIPILIVGYTPPTFAVDMADMGIRQEVHSLEYAEQLNTRMQGVGKQLHIHIKLDTGMSRLGFFAYAHPRTLEDIKKVSQLQGLLIEGVFTHFSAADSLAESDMQFTRIQFQRFVELLSELKSIGVDPELRHCCNSAAAILYPEYALDMIRPGIATYGISPSDDLKSIADLRPLMSLRTTISQIRDYDKGISISYGRTYTTVEPRRIAVICIGYADGLSRRLSNSYSFLLHGNSVPIVGRICMDMCMIDVTDVPEARVGDVVTIFGSDNGVHLPLDKMAEQLNTIPYEILCLINKRIPRIYLDGEHRIEVLQYIV